MTKLLRLPKLLRYTDGAERVLVDLKLGLNQSAARVFKLNFVNACRLSLGSVSVVCVCRFWH